MEPSLDVLRSRIDTELIDFLNNHKSALRRTAPGAEDTVEEILTILGAGGKRLRPAFCYWGYRSAQGRHSKEILRAAASLELLHTFAIVHDDIMDASPLRRGQPTTQIRLSRRFQGAIGAEKFGVAAAILVGDLSLVLADQLLEQSGFEWAVLRGAMDWYHSMRTEVIAGQYLDILAAHQGQADEDTALMVAGLKSGGYTVEKPLLLGAALAGAPPSLLQELSQYGRSLGIAFQLRDDILGVFGSTDITGKDTDRDLIEGKRTFLIAKARAKASGGEREFLDAHLGKGDLSHEQAQKLREIIRETGALQDTLAHIDRLTQTALASLPPVVAAAPDAIVALSELADLLQERQV